MPSPSSPVSAAALNRLRLDRLNAVTRIFIPFFATPVMLLNIIYDLQYAPSATAAVLVRCLCVPIGFLCVAMSHLTKWPRREEIGLMLYATYVAIDMIYLFANSGFFPDSLYLHGIVQLFICLLVFPITFATYVTFVVGTIATQLLVTKAYGALSFADFSLPHVVTYFTYVFTMIPLFYLIDRTRRERDIANLRLADEVRDRDEIIAGQVGQIAQAKLSEGLASAAQMVAHDLRRPFRLVRHGLDGLLRQADAEAVQRKAKDLAAEVDLSFRKVDGLLQDIMASGSGAVVQASSVSLPEAYFTTLRQELALANGPSLEFATHLTHAHRVLVDPAKLDRILGNLLGNAIAAAPIGGTIKVVTSEANGFVEVVVHNSGSFVEAGERARLFEPFFTRGKRNGTGLGLAIAKRLVEAHGGRIWCTSDRETGTGFHFTLPAAAEADLWSQDDVPSPGQADPSKVAARLEDSDVQKAPEVVVIDDDPFIRDAWRHGTDLDVQTYASPEDFLSALAHSPERLTQASAIITDLYFDNSTMSGFDLADAFSGRSSQPLFLASDAEVGPQQLGAFAAKVAKEPMQAKALRDRVAAWHAMGVAKGESLRL